MNNCTDSRFYQNLSYMIDNLHDFNVFLNSMFFCEVFARKISHNNINKKEFYDTKVIMAISYEYSFTNFLRKLNST